jgi:glycosyltransferase involved in cell wall biosynthesis
MAVAAGRTGTDSLGPGIVIDPSRPDYRNTPVAPGRPQFRYRVPAHGSPAISIVTPFFNTGPVFHDTARSVLAQSWQAWEWLIVNDASSTVAALDVLAHYRQKDERIRVIDLPQNLGPSAARNQGARAARAPCLLFLDSDDLLEPTAAEAWWWFLESYPEFGFVKGFSVGFGAMEYLASSGFHEERAFLDGNRVDITALVRAEVFRAVGGFPESNRDGLEDWEFWLRCARADRWGGVVPEYLSWYRRRGDEALRWPNWQGDGGGASLRARLRVDFAELYDDPSKFPRPRPAQVRRAGKRPSVTADGALEAVDRDGDAGRSRRLLLIVPWMTAGGADNVNLDLTSQLSRRGWQISIATMLQGDTSWRPLFTALTPDVFVLPDIVRLSDYPDVLVSLIASRGIDTVLISNAEIAYRLLPHLRSRCPEVAFLDFCHMEQDEWLDGGYPRLSLEQAASLDRTIVISEHLHAWMVARGRRPADIVVSHNGVSVPDDRHVIRERAAFRSHWVSADVPVVVFAGRLVDQKQPMVFAEMVCRLWREGIEFSVAVAGDGPWLPEVRRRLGQAGRGRARCLGTLPHETLDRVLCGADILCLPSRCEGISLVVQEAMARGVAVVSAEVGGQRELVTPGCGVLIPPGDEDGLVAMYASAVRRLIEDPVERRRLGERARARVRASFTVDQMGSRMDALLRSTTAHAAVRDPVSSTPIIEQMDSAYLPYWEWVHAVAAGRVQPVASLGRSVFGSLTRLEPAYRWGMRRGWTWLPSLRQRLRMHVRGLLGIDR